MGLLKFSKLRPLTLPRAHGVVAAAAEDMELFGPLEENGT